MTLLNLKKRNALLLLGGVVLISALVVAAGSSLTSPFSELKINEPSKLTSISLDQFDLNRKPGVETPISAPWPHYCSHFICLCSHGKNCMDISELVVDTIPDDTLWGELIRLGLPEDQFQSIESTIINQQKNELAALGIKSWVDVLKTTDKTKLAQIGAVIKKHDLTLGMWSPILVLMRDQLAKGGVQGIASSSLSEKGLSNFYAKNYTVGEAKTWLQQEAERLGAK